MLLLSLPESLVILVLRPLNLGRHANRLYRTIKLIEGLTGGPCGAAVPNMDGQIRSRKGGNPGHRSSELQSDALRANGFGGV